MQRIVVVCLLVSIGLSALLGCKGGSGTAQRIEPADQITPTATLPTTLTHDHAPPPRTPEN